MEHIWKHVFAFFGGAVGWVVAEFDPTFPLIIVATIFIVYDAYTAYRLGKRVHEKYPEKSSESKFSSFAFGKLVRQTIPSRLVLIILAFLAEKWVFTFVDIPLSYIVTGIICFEQAWSIMENESSCRNEAESMFWKVLQKIMIDKTSRHFDVDIKEAVESVKNEGKQDAEK